MKEEISKSTHEAITLWQPVVKSSDGKYLAVLSDDSIDRDDEIIDKEALIKILDNDGYTAILVNHENKIENQIGEWINKRIEDADGHTMLVAEPKFYLSNPKAQMIKSMLDEGAKMGVSIGAIPKNAINKKCSDGRERKSYTDIELLEASFVAIPSNRHGRVMAVAKMAKNLHSQTEVTKMENEEINVPVQPSEEVQAPVVEEQTEVVEPEQPKEEVSEETEEVVEENKEVEELKSKIAELNKQLEEEAMKSKKLVEENSEVKKSLEEINKKVVNKAIYDTPEVNQIDKNQLPVFRK